MFGATETREGFLYTFGWHIRPMRMSEGEPLTIMRQRTGRTRWRKESFQTPDNQLQILHRETPLDTTRKSNYINNRHYENHLSRRSIGPLVLTPLEPELKVSSRYVLVKGAQASVVGLAAGMGMVWLASKRWPAFREMPLPFKSFLVSGVACGTALTVADRASLAFERQRYGYGADTEKVVLPADSDWKHKVVSGKVSPLTLGIIMG